MNPNEEQMKAITHFGGITLEAGAGSGKTFVLTEHFIFLVNSYIKNLSSHQNLKKTEEQIRKKLSEMVFMTFTNKAAGELKIRIKKRILSEISKENISPFSKKCWQIVKSLFEKLNIGTIHQFCFTLLKQGHIIKINPDENIIDHIEQKAKLESLYKEWIHIRKEISNDQNQINYLLLHYDEILESIYDIYNDAYMRKIWIYNNNDFHNSFDFYHEFLNFPPLLQLNTFSPHINENSSKNKTKSLEILNKIEIIKNQSQSNQTLFKKLFEYFNNIKRLPPFKKGNDTELNDYWECIKDSKKFFKDNKLSFEHFFQDTHNSLSSWHSLYQDLISYIESKYDLEKGLTFSDLEYYTLKGLTTPEVQSKIGKQYKYFVIDEFQDTSLTQYEIIKKLIGGDYSKLFVVGDIKQAIYGFRGGNLKVFLDSKEKSSQSLTLKSNYRSDAGIVQFNNSFFSHIFPTCFNYQGNAHIDIPMNHQNPKDDIDLFSNNVGPIYLNRTQNNISTGKLSSTLVNKMEAYTIASYIENKLKGEQVAILYKVLSPARFLVEELIKRNIGFTAQIKVPYQDDPIIGILEILLEYYLDKEINFKDQINYLNLVINHYLAHLNITFRGTESSIQIFFNDIEIIGLMAAFKKFLYSLNITNEHPENNITQIEYITNATRNDPEETWIKIKSFKNKTYSTYFHFGRQSHQVTLMTAHASKGLEFEHVILGGIYTNGKGVVDSSILGRFPSSFKSPVNYNGEEESIKTPQYILEHLAGKHSNFSERKRLLYVACTRAKYTLHWVKIDFNDHEFSIPANSWILAFNSFADSSPTQIKICETIDSKNIDFNFEHKASLGNPLFFKDPMGVHIKKSITDIKLSETLGVISELSVTRLATIAECPRKFYIQNICKIDDNNLDLLGGMVKETHFHPITDLQDNEKSNFERGNKYHHYIHQITLDPHKYGTLSSDDQRLLENINNDLTHKRSKFDLIPEKTIKFSLFGTMISGIPDLILTPKSANNTFEIWDYKTGNLNNSEYESYKFQIYCYAYGLYTLKYLSVEEPIKLILYYLDNKTKKEYLEDYDQIENYLYSHWEKLGQLFLTNPKACHYCKFNLLC